MLVKKVFLTIISLSAVTSFALLTAQEQASPKAQDQKAQAESTAQKNSPEVDMSKLSETFGNFIGRNLNSTGIKFDVNALIKGIKDGSEGKPAPLTDQEYETMMAKLQQKVFKELSEKNLKDANDFLTKNANEKGIVVVVPGQLQYKVVKEGAGTVVTEHDSPEINYTGKYLDGSVFGSSEESGPITLPLDQTIPGFSKGIVGMKEGEERRLYIHPDLGYGTSGQLPPNSLLIFDIKLIKANNKKDTADEHKNASSNDQDEDSDQDTEK